MDGLRFDSLARTLATSRRTALKTLIGGSLGVSLAGGAGNNAAAVCKKVGQNCDRNGDCCTGANCRGGECKCKSGRDECSGKCFILDSDERHCGICGNACAAGETCCSSACFDLEEDHENCGTCGHACGDNEFCGVGTCFECPSEGVFCGEACCFLSLNRLCCDGTCVSFLNDENNCGACGVRCPGPACCDIGVCLDDEDFQSDRRNCGACGQTCLFGVELCCRGECQVNCGGRCCEGFQRCVSGNCVIV